MNNVSNFIYDNNDNSSDNIGTSGTYNGGENKYILSNEQNNVKVMDSKYHLIYRYKFTNTFMNELLSFSKIHQYEDRFMFKESWEKWILENEELVVIEENRLKELGYTGNIRDKMFKSGKYYFRKKSTENKIPKIRRNYSNISKELLELMDRHIEFNINNIDFKPKNAYNLFTNIYSEKIEEEIKQLKINDTNSLSRDKDIEDKIKKTYKNRYFKFCNK